MKNTSFVLAEIAPIAGVQNYVSFEGSDKKHSPCFVQKQMIDLLLELVILSSRTSDTFF